ncbi:hypothetical protein DFH06DRAFT_1140707 [Mycena polygramma]|nr:hypothetical protein DFH06DRAFT_1140707 [Mycena polygramma]
MSHPISLLETTLLRSSRKFILRFFDCWDPSTIFLLSHMNHRLRTIVKFYASIIWDVHSFLRLWFPQPTTVLAFLKSAPAIVCGPTVLQFLDRDYPTFPHLDICLDFGGLVEVGKFLAAQGYEYLPSKLNDTRDFNAAILLEAIRFPEHALNLRGERSITQENHGSRSFRFVRRRTSQMNTIMIHVVRCELHRFVFAMHSISVFPRTVFSNRQSFVASQESANEVHVTETGKWLKKHSGRRGQFKIIGLTIDHHQDLETGRRWIGDRHCWIIPCTIKTNDIDILNSQPTTTVIGPSFDVLNWRHGNTRIGTYVRVTEPYLFRAWSNIRKYNNIDAWT